MEVAIISRSIARALRLNEELAEAIALAHDLGHTPFGHSGEDALNDLMKDHGGFEHNRQCIRVVDSIENRYPDFPGLNLTFELREGILKHNTPYDRPDDPPELRLGPSPPLECQVVNAADEIAYNSHDVDDGLSSGILSEKKLEALPLWEKGIERMKSSYGEGGPRIRRHFVIRFLIDYLVTDLVDISSEVIKSADPKSADDIRREEKTLVRFSDRVQKENKLLKQFLLLNLYQYPKLVEMAGNARRIVEGLYRYYEKKPQELPPHILSRLDRNSAELVVADYIAGMTDRFACSEYNRLVEPLANIQDMVI
jgi:dGTPase